MIPVLQSQDLTFARVVVAMVSMVVLVPKCCNGGFREDMIRVMWTSWCGLGYCECIESVITWDL